MFSVFKKKPIKGKLSGVELTLKKNLTLLDNAINEGFTVPYSCKSGSCKECLCVVEEGDVESLIDLKRVISESQVNSQHFLACQTLPLGEVSYRFTKSSDEDYYSAKLYKVTRLSPTIYRVIIQFNLDSLYENKQEKPNIGQSCKVKTEANGELRYYSVSQIYSENMVAFDISHKGDGKFSSWLCDPKNTGKNFFISAFFGNFGENFGCAKNNIAIAGGSALGIVLGNVEKVLHEKKANNILFIHTTHSIDDAYDEKRLQTLKELYPEFNYVRIISGEINNNEIVPNMYAGKIQSFLNSEKFEALTNDQDITNSSCLICGAKAMAEDIINILQKKGVQHSNIETDFF